MSDTAVVLIIEERPQLGDRLRAQLKGPCHILEATRLGEARAQLQAGGDPPELVLSDLRATDRTGLTLYRRLRADPFLEATPVLLVAPAAPPEDTESGADPGPVLPEAVETQVLRRLVGHHLAVEGDSPGPPVSPEASLSETIETVVETRLGEPDFTVEELADAVGPSRRQLTRRMKEAFDATPAAYVRARRLDRAKVLLAAGFDTITAVAEAVGFASPSAFSKAFREATGCAPSTYAERHGE
ncbi:MAG: helix-turn-helix domain-containing protein [Salinibacter sp.]